MTPEDNARVGIDALLVAAGWPVGDFFAAFLHAASGVETKMNPAFTPAQFLSAAKSTNAFSGRAVI